MCVYSLDNEVEGFCTRMWRTLAGRARTAPSRHLETRRLVTTDGLYHSDRTGFSLTTTVPPAGIGNYDQRTQGQLRLAGTAFSSLLQASLDVSVPPSPVYHPPLSQVSALRIELTWAGARNSTPPVTVGLSGPGPALASSKY